MNDQEFKERLWAFPQDASAELLLALHEDPARVEEQARARTFDNLLRAELNSVSAPDDLRQKLLQPQQLESRPHLLSAANTRAANDDNSLRRMLPVAACMVLALGLAFYSNFRQQQDLKTEVLTHLYREAAFLENSQVISLTDVNTVMGNTLGAHLHTGTEADNLEVTYADDCWIALHSSFHMIMKGHSGAVSVMMIPSSPISSEFDFSDERYRGLVTPTAGGNLVVIGNKQEPIEEYRSLLSSNIEWSY